MKRKWIAILAAIALLCSVMVGITAVASAAEERGFGMSLSEWNDDFGQGKEYEDGGIGIGADAHLKTAVYGETISMDLEFTVLPSGDFWYVLAFANTPAFNAGSVHSGTDRGAFAIMLQPGGAGMNFNVFHWKSNGEGFVREDIALGPATGLTGGLDATKPFNVDISLFGEDAHVILSQNGEENGFDLASHALLGTITREQICDEYGRTYLNIASYAQDGALKELKFSKIETLGGLTDTRNWAGEGIVADEQGVSLHAAARYLRPFDANAKYLKVSLNIKMIIGNVDAWFGVGLNKVSATPDTAPAGLNILMRNQGGKLAVQPSLNAFGTGELKLLQDVSLGKIVLELEEVDGQLQLSVNRAKVTHAALENMTFADITDKNGYVFLGFGSYVEGNASENNVVVENVSTNLKDKELIYIEVANMPESGMVGSAIALPQGKVVQAEGEEIIASVAVTDPAGEPVTLNENKFIPAEKGIYTVVYSATDSHNNTATNTYSLTVVDPEDALQEESWKDKENWVAPYGGITVTEAGLQVFAHSYYRLPILMNENVLRVNFHIDGLWDGNDADPATSTDAWVAVGFVNKPAITAPGGFAANGLYVRLNNRDGKLRVSVHHFGILGAEDIAIEDTFASEFDALGDVAIEIQKAEDGQGVRLFVNGKELRHSNMQYVEFANLVDANHCTYLALSAYDNDDADQKLPNLQTRCITLTGMDRERTEIVVDTTPPVVAVKNVPTTGTVGEKIVLPPATVTDDFDSSVMETIVVKGPDGKEVAVVNRSFTPQVAGEYTVTYTATDSAGNTSAPQTFKIAVEKAAGGGCRSSFAAESALFATVCILADAAILLTLARKRKN